MPENIDIKGQINKDQAKKAFAAAAVAGPAGVASIVAGRIPGARSALRVCVGDKKQELGVFGEQRHGKRSS